MLCSLLEATGVSVDYARDGKEALKKIWHTRYDIVFMDILMPVMRGDEAVDVIRKEINQPELVCVAISAFSLAHEVQYYLDIGFDEFIPKPFLFSDVYSCLKRFFSEKFEAKVIKPQMPDTVPEQQINLANYRLSTPMHQNLSVAAELNRLSYIKEVIDDLVSQTPEQNELGYYLLRFVDNYDMDGFLAALKEITHAE